MADSLVIKIDGNIKGYQDKLKQISGQTKNLENQLSSIAKKSAVAFTGLAAAITGSVAAYRQQEQVEIKTRQTIKATGEAAGITAEEIFKMASSLQDVTTFGDEAIIGGQNLLLTFKNLGKDVFPRATEIMLDMSEAMGQDMKSSAIQLGKALNDPTVGLTALSRVGITFNEQQKEQIKSMQQSGDIAGAQAIILKELESQFGGVARASAQGTGVFIQLKNIMGDLAEDIGRELAPVLITVAKYLKGFFTEIRKNKELVKTAAGVIGLTTAIAGITTVVATAGVGFLKLRAIMLTTIATIRGMSLSIKGLIGATGIGLLVVLLSDLALNWQSRFKQMQAIFSAFAKNVTNIGQGLATFFKGVFTLDVDKIKEGYAKVKDAAVSTIDEIKNDPAFESNENDLSPIEQQYAPNPEKVRQKHEEARAVSLEQREINLGIEDENLEEDLERQILADELKNDQELAKLNQQIENEEDAKKKLQLVQDRNDKIDAKRETLALKRQRVTAKERIKMDHEVHQALSDSAFTLANTLVAASGSSAKKLFLIQRALGIAQTLINANMAATLAIATIPPPAGEAVAAQRMTMGHIAAGTIAAQTAIEVQGMQDGGLVEGGIPGVDSVPIMAQRNELVAPAQNFEEVIGSVRAQREAEALGEGGKNVNIHVTYDSPEASQIITVGQVEDASLGISRDSMRV